MKQMHIIKQRQAMILRIRCLAAMFAGMLFIAGCVGTTQFGVKDAGVEEQIVRANSLIGWYKEKNYTRIEKQLKNDLQLSKGDAYAKMRLMNELADLYSNFVFDLEQAVELDRKVLAIGAANPKQSDFFLKFNSANNHVLADDNYKRNYINSDNARSLNWPPTV